VIKEFVDRWEANKSSVEAVFRADHPDDYKDIVKAVIEAIKGEEYGGPDPNKIREIDDGDYQGTLVFVIGDNSYKPYTYWCVRIEYGSCSGCDTLKAIRRYGSDPPTDEQVKGYMTLALHVVQGLRLMFEP